MSKLSDIAKKMVGNGGLTSGLEKIKLDDVIKTYPNGVTITGAEMVSNNGSSFPVFTFAEDTSKYFSGGKALREMVEAWIEEYDGDLGSVNDELRRESVIIKMRKVNTKKGKTYTTVTIVGTVKTAADSEADPEYNPETGEVINEPAEDDNENNPF